jgi:peptidoglycan hydrolase CwlO-like protein
MLIVAIVALVISAIGVWVSYAMFQGSKEKIRLFETNCIATLKQKIDDMDKTINNLRGDITNIYEKLEDLNARTSRIEGRLNGK